MTTTASAVRCQPRPRFRGVVPSASFFVRAGRRRRAGRLGAQRAAATAAAAIYAAPSRACSAPARVYHRVDLAAAAPRRGSPLDHSMIFVLIAGTYTPFALLVLDGTLRKVVLVGVWTRRAPDRLHAALGRRAQWLTAATYVGARLVRDRSPCRRSRRGPAPGRSRCSRVGGVATRPGRSSTRAAGPTRGPPTFGYHEIFHVLVVVAAAAHFSGSARRSAAPAARERPLRTKFPLKPGTLFRNEWTAAPSPPFGQSTAGRDDPRGSSLQCQLHSRNGPITVRALAEGEQLLTLRKGGIREENKHFEIEHDRFFLYPTFDHQRNDCVRDAHVPELGRALEEGVWPDDEPPRQGARPGRRHPAARPRAHPLLGRGRGQLPDHRPARDRRAVAVLRLDDRLRGEAAGLEAASSAARDRSCARTASRGP